MFFDSHVHFTDGDDAAALVGRARAAGVDRLLAVGGCAETNESALAAARQFGPDVRAAVGYDRDQVGQPAGAAGRAAAIGEIGLDYHYSPESAGAQKVLFAEQLALARDLELPVIVHSREAEADIASLLERHAAAWHGPVDRLGAVHCFTGGPEFARQICDLGYYVGFSGIITFRNADAVRDAARAVPGNRLLIETDSPYLAPVPHRGKRNEPAYLVHVAAKLAEVRGMTVDEIAELTSRNAERLFGATSGSDSGVRG